MSNSKTKLPSHPHLWFIRVKDANNLLPASFLQHAHPTTRQRYQTIKSQQRKKQFLASRWLIQQAIEHFFSVPIALSQIEEQTNDKPRLLDLPGECFFSLTHTDNWVVFAISTTPIGIDMERNKPRQNAVEMAELFMSEDELIAYSNKQNLADFYRFWCYKEAYYKSLSTTQQAHTRFSEIDTSQTTVFETQHLYEIVSEQFHFTLYSEHKIQQVENFLIGRVFDVSHHYQANKDIQICWHFMNKK